MMSELEKLKAGLDYCFDDPEVAAIKDNAIKQCAKFNSIDPTDYVKEKNV